jgi:subfamily B ATP-binding cassette protein MsbA
LDDFIHHLPDGLNTMVGENGIKLSGGQKQRVVLARSLLMNPSILILDEATSELDSETEKKIHQTIKELSKELTVIIVAHRLSTVKEADKVYVLEKGLIVESGNYQDLLEQKGRLYQLDLLQR